MNRIFRRPPQRTALLGQGCPEASTKKPASAASYLVTRTVKAPRCGGWSVASPITCHPLVWGQPQSVTSAAFFFVFVRPRRRTHANPLVRERAATQHPRDGHRPLEQAPNYVFLGRMSLGAFLVLVASDLDAALGVDLATLGMETVAVLGLLAPGAARLVETTLAAGGVAGARRRLPTIDQPPRIIFASSSRTPTLRR